MSYIDYLDQAVTFKVEPLDWSRVEALKDVGDGLQSIWNSLEIQAALEKYDVLNCSKKLRHLCIDMLFQLHLTPGTSIDKDLEQLREKDKEYGGSWQRRGGPGAFFTAVRKWDRIEHQLNLHGDLRKALETDKREEGILDDIGDLRRYLILWESWRISKEGENEVGDTTSVSDVV